MRRCTYCFRFLPGRPTYCAFCGRSFDVRLCPRGHRNPRGATFCAECGSGELSVATPRPSLLFRFSGVALYAFAFLIVAILLGSAALSLFYQIDWNALAHPVFLLIVMVGILYWATTLLPGPIRRVGQSAGRRIWKSLKGRDRK